MGDIVDGKALFTAIDASMRKAKTVRMTVEGVAALETDASFNADGTTNVAVSTPAGDMRFVDNVLYFAPKDGLPNGSPPWVAIDENTEDPDLADMYAAMKSSGEQSPQELAALMAKGRTTVTQVAGDGTVTYQTDVPATVVVENAAKTLGSSAPKELATMRANAKGRTVGYEMVVDGRNLPSKVTMDGASIAAMSGESGIPDTVIRYSRWGQPVDAQAPAREDVMPYDEAAEEG